LKTLKKLCGEPEGLAIQGSNTFKEGWFLWF
jgi:hypothetical protein